MSVYGDRFWCCRQVTAEETAGASSHRGDRRSTKAVPLWAPGLPVSFWNACRLLTVPDKSILSLFDHLAYNQKSIQRAKLLQNCLACICRMFVYLGFWNTIRRKFVVIGTPLSRFEYKKSSQKPIDIAYRRYTIGILCGFSYRSKMFLFFPYFYALV